MTGGGGVSLDAIPRNVYHTPARPEACSPLHDPVSWWEDHPSLTEVRVVTGQKAWGVCSVPRPCPWPPPLPPSASGGLGDIQRPVVGAIKAQTPALRVPGVCPSVVCVYAIPSPRDIRRIVNSGLNTNPGHHWLSVCVVSSWLWPHPIRPFCQACGSVPSCTAPGCMTPAPYDRPHPLHHVTPLQPFVDFLFWPSRPAAGLPAGLDCPLPLCVGFCVGLG